MGCHSTSKRIHAIKFILYYVLTYIFYVLFFIILFSFFVSSYSYETLLGIANFFHERTKYRPKVGIICGSGLGSLAESLKDVDIFPYESIPNFPVSTVEGHAGQMIFGLLDDVPVMCMQGRFHYYEGYPLAKVVLRDFIPFYYM